MSSSAFVIGSTGLTGSEILKQVNQSEIFDSISTVTRRGVKITGGKINNIIEADTAKWPEIIAKNCKRGGTFFSGFGTTRLNAGSLQKFKEIDHGVNYACAKAAKEAGVETYVLVSSIGSSSSSFLPYFKIKGELEDDIIALKFPRTIILRPGILFGSREKSKGIPVSITESVGKLLHHTWLQGLLHSTSGEEIGKVALNAAIQPFDSDAGPTVQIIEGAELDRLTKTV